MTERVELDFLCRCRENVVDSQERLQARMAATGWLYQPDKFLSTVTAMAMQYDAVLSYDLDQWWRAILTVDSYDDQGNAVTDLMVTVECDLLEDGFAELVLWLLEHQPEPS